MKGSVWRRRFEVRVGETLLLGAVLLGLGCSDNTGTADSGGSTGQAGGGAGDVAAETADLAEISCENACQRASRCEGTLVTAADCEALCQKAPDPTTYACCLQYADACNEVKNCLEGTVVVCEPKGDPWVPLAMFEACECGDGQIDKQHECKETGPANPCPTNAVCIKPANFSDSPFCAVDCTLDAAVCPSGTYCQKTPKSNYCKRL